MRRTLSLLFLIFLLISTSLFASLPPLIQSTYSSPLPSGMIASVGEEINWPEFWQTFKQYALWDLEWFNGFSWVSVKGDLAVQLSYPEPNRCKINLIFDASHAGHYRLTFAIKKVVRDYVERISKYQYELTYDDIIITFDWSDCTEITGLQFTHGVRDGYFWFRIRRNNVPLGTHVEIDPATVGTSTTSRGVVEAYQRKGFYAEGLFWAFYRDATSAGWETSADGITWDGDFTSIGACSDGAAFSVWFDGTYIHYARYDSITFAFDLFYRRGTPVNDGSITWSAVEQTVHDGEILDSYERPCIAVDSAGYAWIGVFRFWAGGERPYVLKNDNLDGTWALDFATELNAADDLGWRVGVVPLTDSKMYLIYSRSDEVPLGNLYDGGWIGEENDLADYAIEQGLEFSAVALEDNIHFVYTTVSPYQIRHNERVWGVGWNASDILVQDNVLEYTSPALSVDPSTGDLYCFWTSTSTDHVYFKQYTGGAWGDLVDWIGESIDGINYDYLISSFFMDYGGYIGLLYVTKLASPYNVRFAFFTVPYTPPPPSPYTAKITSFAIAADATWTDYNLTANKGVPKDAIAEIVVSNKNADFARIGGVRTDGSGLNRYIDNHEAERGGVTTANMFVKVDESTGLIECYSEIQGDVDFYLLGYFEGIDFTESFMNLGQPGLTWTAKDLSGSGVPASAVVQIMMGNNATGADYFAGVREVGSALERGFILDEAEAEGWTILSTVVKADASSMIEWKGGSATEVTMWLLGWFGSNVDFTEGFADYSPADDNTWTSKIITESPADAILSFTMMHKDSGAETFCGLREEGSSLERKIQEHEAEGGGLSGFHMSITVDGEKIVEVYCEDASEANFFYMGYFIIEVVVNEAPVNSSASITNMDDTDNLYARYKNYIGVSNVSDADGFADIDYTEFRINQTTSNRAIFRYDEDTDTFSVQSGGGEWNLSISLCSAVESGDWINVTWYFTPQWNATEEADIELELFTIDDQPESDQDTVQTDYADVVTDLLCTSIEGDDPNDPDRVDIGASVTVSFAIKYADDPASGSATTLYPSDAEFSSVSIYDSANNNEGTDNTIVNGEGSVAVTVPATVGSDTYNVYIDMVDDSYTDAEETPTEEIIADKLNVVFAANTTTPKRDAWVEISWTITRLYDSSVVVSFSIDVNRNETQWKYGCTNSSAYDVSDIEIAYIYDADAVTDDTYGLTVFQQTSVTVTWIVYASGFIIGGFVLLMFLGLPVLLLLLVRKKRN